MTGSDHGLRIAMIGARGVPASWGGVERHVEELGARLAQRGHAVTVFCRAGYADATSAAHRGMQLVTLPTSRHRGAEALVHSLSAAARTLGHRYDIVHFHAVGPGLAAPLPRYLSGAKVVQTIHGLDAGRLKWGRVARTGLSAGTRMSARVPHATITVSRTLCEHYQQVYGRTAHYVQNGTTAGPRVGQDVLRERFGLTPGSYLLSVGRLVPEKAVDVLLRAFALLPGELRLVVAGGSSHTDDYAALVRELAARDPRVLLPGYVYGEDLAALYTNARAFVLPSLLEGLPLTLLEAVGYELPLVLSSIAPHLEVVGGERPGARLAEPGSVVGLRDALQRSMARPAVERTAAGLLRHQLLDHYDWDRATDRLLDVYDTVLGRTPVEDLSALLPHARTAPPRVVQLPRDHAQDAPEDGGLLPA